MYFLLIICFVGCPRNLVALTSSFKKLEEALAEYYGWAATPSSRSILNSAIDCKAGRLQIAREDYCEIAATSQSEMLALVEEAAVGESSFFREPAQFDRLRTSILPSFGIAEEKPRPLRLWSSACSTGEEAYSLAIICDQLQERDKWKRIEILATDVRNGALLVASQARYDLNAMGQVDPAVLERCFSETRKPDDATDRRMYTLVPEIRRLVTFRRVNLREQIFWKAMAGRFDVIVCANLLLFLHPVAIRQMVGRLAHSLRPGGFLMVAPTECTFVVHPKLRQDVESPSFFYRIPEEGDS